MRMILWHGQDNFAKTRKFIISNLLQISHLLSVFSCFFLKFMFQIQPFLTCLGVSPYFKESGVKTIVNSMLFIDFIHSSRVDPKIFYFYNVRRIKNNSPILHIYPSPETIRQLYIKYFKAK